MVKVKKDSDFNKWCRCKIIYINSKRGIGASGSI